jgi:DNA-binding CsgD family transcriptional regulator
MNPTSLSALYPGRLKLTATEYAVFCLVGQGMSSREIATSLGISPKTVAAHRQNFQNKLGLNARTAMVEAVKWVMKQDESPSEGNPSDWKRYRTLV